MAPAIPEKKQKFSIRRLFGKLLGINDSPHRIALGAGLGLFLGVFPGTGPIAAIVCAFIFRANKAASLAGALAVNTWINFVAFPAALAIGAVCMRLDPLIIKNHWSALFGHFTWKALYSGIVVQSVTALVIGYSIIGFVLGAVGYVNFRMLIEKMRTKPGLQQPPRGSC